MSASIATVTQKQLLDFLLNVALVRPVFIWGAPGIGKSTRLMSCNPKILAQFIAARVRRHLF